MEQKKKKLVFVSYGDILYDNGYKTRLMGELTLASKLSEYDLYLISFEKKESWEKNKQNLSKLQENLKKLNVKTTIVPRQNRYYWDIYQEANKLREILTEIGFDQGILHGHSIYATYFCLEMKKYFSSKVVFDMHGLTGPELADQQANIFKIMAEKYAEYKCLHEADHILTASASLQKYIVENDSVNEALSENITTLPCLVNEDEFDRVNFENIEKRRKELDLPIDKQIAVFLGGSQNWQSPAKIVDFVRRHDLFLLIITHDIRSWENFLSNIDQSQKKVISVPHDKVWQYLQLADFGLLFREKKLLNKISFPTKAAEYLICGLPIIHNGAIDDITHIVDNNTLGLNIDKNDSKSQKRFFHDYQKDKYTWKNRCRFYATNNLTWQSHKKLITDSYEKLYKNKLFLLVTSGCLGGAQKYVAELAMYFQKKGWQVVVGTGREKNDKFKNILAQQNIKYIEIDSLVRDINPLADLHAWQELRNVIRRYRFDVVHTNSSKAGLIGRLAAKMEGVKKIYYTAHGWVFNNDIWWPKREIYKYLERLAAGWCDKIFCVSEYERKSALYHQIAKDSKLVKIHNGIDLKNQNMQINANSNKKYTMQDKMFDRLQTWKKNSFYIVGTVANMFPYKNLGLWVEVVKDLVKDDKSYRFVIVGDGPERKNIRKLISEYGLEKYILLTGEVTNPEKYLKLFDVFLLTSSKEGLPYAILEAAKCNIPMVASDINGIGEMIVNEETGILVKYNDRKKYALAVNRLIMNEDEARKLASNMKIRLEKYFDKEKMLARYWTEYTNSTQA